MDRNRSFCWLLVVVAMILYATAVAAVTEQEGPMIKQLAEGGSAGAQVLLAGMYLRGEGGVARDDRRAAAWFEKAAVQGNPYAEMKLGDFYEKGQGVPKNAAIAADWREKAANRGNVRAQRLLGKMYMDDNGVARDQGKAEYWLNRAALEGGDAQAQYLLALMHLKGKAAAPNPGLASHLLARAATQGYDEAVEMLHLVQELGYSLDESEHRGPPHLRKLAQDGDTEAQYRLGLHLEKSLFGDAADRREAVDWLERAAAGGHVMAMQSLARIYDKGLDGVPANPGKASYWKQKAEQQAK